MDTDCSDGHDSIDFDGGGNTVTGAVIGNGSVDAGGGRSTYRPFCYDNGSGCV
ncbi:MAG: hypothetical protein ACLP50_30125 [Solirubrobacteraceae bacterium]|jgi:hypothetical protein